MLPAPICADFEWNVLGTIEDDPLSLPEVEIKEPCKSCYYSHICGGRCLFFNRERLWGDEGFKLVCSTAKHLIDEVAKLKPKIQELAKNGIIDKEELYYPRYNNTTEIIP